VKRIQSLNQIIRDYHLSSWSPSPRNRRWHCCSSYDRCWCSWGAWLRRNGLWLLGSGFHFQL